MGDVDRDVAEEADVARVAVRLQRGPLPVEEKLPEGVHPDGLPVLLVGVVEGLRVAVHEVVFPLMPRGAAVSVLQRHKQRVVVEPVRLLVAERVEWVFEAVAVIPKALVGRLQDRFLARHEAGVVDVVVGQLFERSHVVGGEEPGFEERARTDQERVAGEGRQAGVGRCPVPDRPQRQHLPEALVGASEQIGKLVRLGSKVTNPVASGKGRDVKQKATNASRIQG